MGHCPLPWTIKDSEQKYIRIIFPSYNNERRWRVQGLRLAYDCSLTYTTPMHLLRMEHYPHNMQTRPCRHSVHAAQRNELPRWSHEGGDIQANLCPNAISYSWFRQAKGIILRDFVHIDEYMSTFSGFCPHIWVYVHISGFLSAHMSICPHFLVFVHIYEYMSTFMNICPNFGAVSYTHLTLPTIYSV